MDQIEISQSSACQIFGWLTRYRDQSRVNPGNIFFEFVDFCMSRARLSHAQTFQDLFALYFNKSKKGGFFVEFGATNGIDLSNTFLLEKEYRWKGLLAEPAKCWHGALAANRRATIDKRCVWDESGLTLAFAEASTAEFSTLVEFKDRDGLREARENSLNYDVPTVSLNELLATHAAPRVIDYMSVDTEGSEYRILKAFDFSRYDIRTMTIEHNFCEPDRENIRVLLAANGFQRVLEPLSQWDDWYVKASLLK
ncbi:MAG: hypothetical protein JWN07_809 [Hyphomicrobiales bacterium]|nr:hypothetical protein [Hyphomicrobiales bacterium]